MTLKELQGKKPITQEIREHKTKQTEKKVEKKREKLGWRLSH